MSYDYPKKSLWKWVLIYIVIGAIVYGVVYYLFFYKKGGYSYSTSALENAQMQNIATDTADWKTYTSTKYGYEMKYPSYLNLESENVDVTFHGSDATGTIATVVVSTYGNPFDVVRSVYVDSPTRASMSGQTVQTQQDTTINGRKAFVSHGFTNATRIPYIDTILELGPNRVANIESYGANNLSDIAALTKIHSDMVANFKLTQ